MVFSPDLGGKNGSVLSMRMQVILDSPFTRPGSAPMWGGKKGEFRDWTKEKSKTVPMQIFWGVKEVYYGIVLVENYNFFFQFSLKC